MVAEDPGLSLKVLHLANSSLFGTGSLITSPVDAVMCLGTDMIAAIVLSQSLFRHYASLQRPEMDLERVWTHSWETARLAQHYLWQGLLDCPYAADAHGRRAVLRHAGRAPGPL